MGTRTWRMAAAAVVVCIAAIAPLTGCVQSSSVSRHALYDGIDGLAADSSSIVVGTVSEQHEQDGATISSLNVSNAPANPQLGNNLTERVDPAAVGDIVEVRQDTTPHLEVGTEYLLFLTPSMLPGAAGTQLSITGAVAGLYVRSGDDYKRVVNDSGDTLPDTITTIGNEAE